MRAHHFHRDIRDRCDEQHPRTKDNCMMAASNRNKRRREDAQEEDTNIGNIAPAIRKNKETEAKKSETAAHTLEEQSSWPNGSNVAEKEKAIEIIALLSDDEDHAITENPEVERGSPEKVDDDDGDKKPAAKALKGDELEAVELKVAVESQNDEVEEVGRLKSLPPVASAGGGDEEGEIQIIGSTGQNSLADFPHSREHCVVHPQALDPAVHCANCFCFVCDKPVDSCEYWEEHCHAKYADSKWRQARSARLSGASVSAISTHRRYSVKELLESITSIYPNEVTPPSPPFTTNLHHYQKQSRAFLLDIELHQTAGQRVKSGWLCSEVGMGKSAVVIALVAANPVALSEQPSVDDIKLASRSKGKRLKVKATVVFTTVSLLGQWEDEVKKHAQSLKVYCHHPSSKMKIADLADADIVVTTATFKWANVLTTSFEFRRVVVDESHLIGSVSARMEQVLDVNAECRLCVTATPFTTSLSDLDRQSKFLRLEDERTRLSPVNFLDRYVIRHLKSQLINGEPALALPKSTTTTKMVSMTDWERNTFHDALRRKGQQTLYRYQAMIRILEMSWYAALAKPIMCEDSSKVELLKKDLQELWQSKPNMRVVVFSQFLEQQRYAKKAVQSMGIKTYNFNGSLEPHIRDKYIREFQSLETPGPAVFLATIKTGSVGITITGASHVFLLEPCIDPAT